jgi:hypothetical protein
MILQLLYKLLYQYAEGKDKRIQDLELIDHGYQIPEIVGIRSVNHHAMIINCAIQGRCIFNFGGNGKIGGFHRHPG